MIILKIFYRIKALIIKLFYKIIYNQKIIWNNSTFRNNFKLAIEDKGKVEIGKNVFFNNGCSIFARNKIAIGEGCLFGENVKIYDHNHRFVNPKLQIKQQGYTLGKITIGRHCWICSNVIILKDTTIGDNCVIGAGCIIKGNVPENTIVECVQELKYTSYI